MNKLKNYLIKAILLEKYVSPPFPQKKKPPMPTNNILKLF